MQYPEYIANLQKECDSVYTIANEARAKGFDPKNCVEIPQAHDLADRTQKLLVFLHSRNTAEQIRELTSIHEGNRERVALDISKIVAAESYLYGLSRPCGNCGGDGIIKDGWKENDCRVCESIGQIMTFDSLGDIHWKDTLSAFENISDFENKTKAAISIYHGVCAGLAVLTEGILVAPLEGVVSTRILENNDGTDCISISYAGPIRSAGGTGQALSVLIGDILRRMFKIGIPVMAYEEVERYKEEVSAYARSLQYRPSNPQLEIIAKNCPVYLDGEGVGNEVSGQRDLKRVKTNKVREGSVLVMCEGLVLKAPKIMKYVKELGLNGWDWLNTFISNKDDEDNIVQANDKYLHDVLAGRPIIGEPMKVGGYRLRYGRSRLGGLATTSIHPATMKALNGFIITGTQMKYERPGKATVATPCTEIDGPYIQFTDGSAKRIDNADDLPDGLSYDLNYPIEKIWDLGEILIPVGEFLENNHVLIPSAYNIDWHKALLAEKYIDYPKTFDEAISHCKKYDVPMAPDYTCMFSDITADELKIIYRNIDVSVCNNRVKVNPDILDLVYRLNMDVSKIDDICYITGNCASVFINNILKFNPSEKYIDAVSGLDLINILSDYEVRPKTTYRIGARMGKPEGAKLREMKPPIHCLFPLGQNIGNQRRISEGVLQDNPVEVGIRINPRTNEETLKGVDGGINTEFIEIREMKLGVDKLWNEARTKAGVYGNLPIKGVKGLTSTDKFPENIVKGILRYENDISVFRDGTIRFDMVDITMTHFKPSEVSLTLDKAKQLGYEVNDVDEVIELKPQDIVISSYCAERVLDATKYIDMLLTKLYGIEPYYNCDKVEDLFGHLMMGLAPHTSGAILCRLIGVADIKGHYGHPFFHAAKRRNCDGDIDCVMLLLDGLINFSKSFLSSHRGGQMDAPLILTTKINPSEIDKEALNVDIGNSYPLAFYELTMNYAPPKEALKVGVKTVEGVLGTPLEIEGFEYTHGTNNCSDGPKHNPYNTLESMRQKTMAQFALGDKLHSVDNKNQSSRLINRHLIRDMRGNLRAFGQQKVRCTKCGASYRRPPISGKCNTIMESKKDKFSGEKIDVYCEGNIILTVSKGSVNKYSGLMTELIERHGCNEYTNELCNWVKHWSKQTFYDKDEKIQQSIF
tara:strand:- start:188 stop:3637 length:3450 start_codon:yes stop_codon:yes gene_type:complete